MDVLIYNGLNTENITGFQKFCDFLQQDDFKSADVKKIDDNLYRAKLNKSDRILFAIYQYGGQKYALILEYLKNHDYENSRFLQRGVVVDEARIPSLTQMPEQSVPCMAYVNPNHRQVALLNKVISFDDCQHDIYQQQPPMILIGSAGSGKTALLLEKLKRIEGDVLYVTLSNFLVKNSHDLYYSHHYQNEKQQVDFFSFEELLESIAVPHTKPLQLRFFSQWYSQSVRSHKITESAHKLFEEFRGVLTGGVDAAYLSQDDYVNLGVKQSIYAPEVRAEIYSLFLKYLDFLKQNQYYDSNILSFDYAQNIQPRYDFVVVDEVQDLTTVQLFLILKMLRQQGNFLLCGDSNQIVHPNFFSWANVKTLFYKQDDLSSQHDILHILQTNYRNSLHVTEIANRILLLKQARFGSIDRESNYLVRTNGDVQGAVRLLHDKAEIVQQLDVKTKHSTRFAVVVMRDEQKIEAQRFFQTPLVFSIQEAKGLEYENIILYNFVSAENQKYQLICDGVSQADLQKDLKYSRNKDKNDKSLEVYKFYINALYVALTRAIANLYWVESNSQHPLLGLLGFGAAAHDLELSDQKSSMQDWQREAHKLELQGKQEQADRIRQEVLKEQKPDWPVYTQQTLADLVDKAMTQGDKKAKLMLFEYAIVYDHQVYLTLLKNSGFNPAKQYFDKPEVAVKALKQKYYMIYGHQKTHPVLASQLSKFGLDFKNTFAQTPLMAAIWMGDFALVKTLIDMGVNTDQVDNQGFNALLVAIRQAMAEPKYAKQVLSRLCDALNPDSLSLQIDGRLLKLQRHSMEFWLFQVMCIFVHKLMMPVDGVSFSQARDAIVANNVVDAIAHFPLDLMPEYRKKRTYVSGIFSKNEYSSSQAYSKKIFLRTQLGHYVLHPNLQIKVQGEWLPIYQWLLLEQSIVFYLPDNVPDGTLMRHVEVLQARDRQERLVQRREFLYELMGKTAPQIASEPSVAVVEPMAELKPEPKPEPVNELDQGVWTDPKTGLMWMRCSMGQTWDGKTAHGKAKLHTLDQAHQIIEKMNKKGGFAGYTDWHLPDIDTLRTLMIPNQKGYSSPKGVLLLPNNGKFGAYWSTSLNTYIHDSVWGVYFSYGGSGVADKSSSYYVRAVRGENTLKTVPVIEIKPEPEAQAKPIAQAVSVLPKPVRGGVWTEPKTGMMWMRCSMGQTWDGKKVQGDAQKYNWYQARQAIEEMNKNGGFAGHADWQLPDIDMLKALMLNRKADVLLRANTSDRLNYWSASTNPDFDKHIWVVNFSNRSLVSKYQDNDYYVRAVRAGHEQR